MAATRRRFWILGLVGVALVGLTAAAVNWRSLTRNATEAWEAQSEKTAISLFRMGEVMSIQARLRERFGSKPDVQYDDVGGIRVLSISFDRAPEGGGSDPAAQARIIAVAAIQATAKTDQIDEVTVALGESEPERTPLRFESSDLLRPAERP